MIATPRYIDFINQQLEDLKHYDSLRPNGHVYEFHHHSQRVANSMRQLATKMGYETDMADALYWATLPHDIGKMALDVSIWDMSEKPNDIEKSARRKHTKLGVDIIHKNFGEECSSDPFLRAMIDIMENHHEHCNGTGYMGKTTSDLSEIVRMACICDAFDGYSVYRPHFGDRDVSPSAVINRMEVEKAGQFDPHILSIFKELQLSCP